MTASDIADAAQDGRALRLLWGGVGDGRHVIVTLADVAHVVSQARKVHPDADVRTVLTEKPVHMELWMNDLHPATLARDILILDGLHALGIAYAGLSEEKRNFLGGIYNPTVADAGEYVLCTCGPVMFGFASRAVWLVGKGF